MRIILGLLGIISAATIMAEVLGVGLLYARGQLTAESLSTIQAVLAGEDLSLEDEESEKPGEPSLEEVIEERSLRVLSLRTREEELKSFKGLLDRQAEELTNVKAAYEQNRDQFSKELEKLKEENESEATDQARGIVSSAKPAAAVSYLMGLDLLANVRIVRGVNAKVQVKILEQFAQGTDEEMQRGRQIFEAIAEGAPKKDIIAEAEDAIGDDSRTN
ncbi:hypothetical protein [Calycomorphotria hydatis]|uniref:Uncharacterized protein n=1 Tax=Calycomorphotria hydatis TaxID=2528027 RepID=A0A517TBA7_9PLAN|nr:hypothetical protein [Calycomorphotria hydatis]QDT65646.1 hypothetical protein V22_29050 [Calycomorphotria hydatis]